MRSYQLVYGYHLIDSTVISLLGRFRGEMFDRDIQLLQFCGANMEPNKFLLHVLHKFGLANWAAKVSFIER